MLEHPEPKANNELWGIYPRKEKNQMESDNYQVTISLNDLWHLKSESNFGKHAQKEVDKLRTENMVLKQEILNYKTLQPTPVSATTSITNK